MLSVSALWELANTRLREATALYVAKEYAGSAYLSGYAVELMLKARICLTLDWEGFPETRAEFAHLQSFKIHDLKTLAVLSGLHRKLGTKYAGPWSNVETWSPEDRYRPAGPLSCDHARRMLASASYLVRKLWKI